MTDTLKGQITNEQKEVRKENEEKLKDFEPLHAKPPHWLSTMGKNEWTRLYPYLKALPISELDRTLLAMYCNSFAQYREALKDIAQNGQIMFETNSQGVEVKKKNPSVEIMNAMSKEIRGIAGQMGLSLDSRLRLVGLNNEDDEQEDPMQKFKKRGKS
ncbi:phage terminase small subunit P27 family [Bacillus subtilis]|uniref:phage terminase small subunit P27 family n=1 Tax=Bacillus TaxID=1386 RepID=UPI00034DDED9|nr:MULTISPECIES: phage terminase small subunit P27 family [Bacillus]MCY8547302.1 phage terminase small subunit P27 family [Bacillus vallismortis]MDY7432040.1 phage terminase small subunit P27 family [Bacillus sp. V26]MEC1268650.1 phage terminase small subunit P27 family [Bacillus vallismortis]MEC1663342.1 phage terminase small subunit P27 family [Bacillus halotolerans]MEC1709843.1 phage terminase small subunit P27 family [Bacillus mojavensis]